MIVDGNEQELDAVADRMLQRLAGNSGGQPSRSEAEQLRETMKSQGYSDDWIDSAMLQAQHSQRIAQKAAAEQATGVVGFIQNQRMKDLVNDALATHAKADERVKINRASILEIADKKFRTDPEIQNAVKRGDIDRLMFDELIDGSVDEWYSKSGIERSASKTQNLSVDKKSGESGDSKDAQDADKGSALTFDDLNDHQQDYYLATVGNVMRYSNKPVTEKEAQKIAMERASKLEKPQFSGKR